jgi:Ca-activated chloride channel family protein
VTRGVCHTSLFAMWSKPCCLIGALLVSLPSSVMVGQDRPVFSTGSDLVVVHATIKDRGGAYVTGLTREAFAILEDGRPQNAQLFTNEDAPVTVGLLIDSSGSMQPNRDRVIAAAAAFAESSHPNDELFALAFNDSVHSALPPPAPFTSDVAVLQDALTTTSRASGRTALFDAIAAGLDYLGRGRHERRVLVIVSDGDDNASHTTFEEVVTKTQASNAVIYTVALVDPVERDTNPGLLRRLAQANGGEAFAPRNADDITEVLQHIARDIRHCYTLGYVSTNIVRDGALRQIRLIVQSPDRRRLVVRTRSGYLAGLPQPRRDADVR